MPITFALASVKPGNLPAPIRVLDRFGFDSAVLTPSHLTNLRHVASHVSASWKSGQPVKVIRLVGHADSRGSAAYNEKLGLKRATAVRQGLILALNAAAPGLSQKIRFETLTRGSAKPTANKTTEDGRSLNRRVEVYLVAA